MTIFQSSMSLFHSCERAAELMSQALDEPLDLGDQMRLRIHLKMCSDCQEVEKQMKILRTLTSQMGTLDLGMEDESIPSSTDDH